MNPLKVIMLNVRSLSNILEMLDKDKIGYIKCENEREVRVEVEDIVNIDGSIKQYIYDVLSKMYSYNDEEIEKVYEKYDYIIFY